MDPVALLVNVMNMYSSIEPLSFKIRSFIGKILGPISNSITNRNLNGKSTALGYILCVSEFCYIYNQHYFGSEGVLVNVGYPSETRPILKSREVSFVRNI